MMPPLDEGTVMTALVFAALIFVAGMLLGSALTTCWHESVARRRGFRVQCVPELHGEAVFEKDEVGRMKDEGRTGKFEPMIRGGVAMDNDETRWGGCRHE